MQLNSQIAVAKNNTTLLEFLDAMYFEPKSAWPELGASRIRIAIKDYSDRKNIKYCWNNVGTEEVSCLYEEVKKLPITPESTQFYGDEIEYLETLKKSCERTTSADAAMRLEHMLAQNPGLDPNEMDAVTAVKTQTASDKDALLKDIQARIQVLKKKQEEAQNARITLFTEHKILPYAGYRNPENDKEFMTTSCTISYNPAMRFPIVVEIGNGWATKLSDDTGRVKWQNEHDVTLLKKMLTVSDFLKMLKKCCTFIDSMIACGLQNYFDASVLAFAEKKTKGMAGSANDAESVDGANE